MTGGRSSAREIVPFLPPDPWWWRWLEGARVIGWESHGGTIAFREEFDAILEHLQDEGLPPAGSIVLLLAACRDGWSGLETQEILERRIASPPPRRELSKRKRETIAATIQGLARVRSLSAELRASLDARNVVAEIVFERAQGRAPPGESRRRVDAWRAAGPGADGWRPAASPELLFAELEALHPGLFQVDEERVRTRLGTGLDAPPRPADPADLPPPPGAALGGVPHDLLADPETRGVALLARQVTAAVALPRALSAPDDLPEGGLADIANRGPLDRLLLSELAHDESTLAARLALGEALYHRRERATPPTPRGRIVLLDAGVRMWGVPRAYATAVALALRAQAAVGGTTTVFRAAASDLESVDLATKEGVVAHLAALETAAHPGRALAAFAAEHARAAEGADAVLVTCEEALADPDFRRLAAACPFDPLHVVTVARDGRIRLLARSRRGTRVVREATLDLDVLLAPPPGELAPSRPSPPLFDRSRYDLPAIFGVDPFPLRLPAPPDFRRSWWVEGVGAFTFTSDGRLLLSDDPLLGARQVAEGLPRGRLLACEPQAHGGRTLAVVGRLSPHGLHALSIDVASLDVETTRLAGVDPRPPDETIQIHAGRVLVRSRDTLSEVDPLSGRVVSACAVPRHGGQIGRVVQDLSGGPLVLAAGPARVETLVDEAMHADRPMAIFETVGVEGFTRVTRRGRAITGDGRVRFRGARDLGEHPRFLGASRDGKRFALQWSATAADARRHEWRIVEVLSGEVSAAPSSAFLPHLLEPALAGALLSHTVKRTFAGVGLLIGGGLVFTTHETRHGCEVWRIVVRESGAHWVPGRNGTIARVEPFRPCGRGLPYHLRTVRFRDGSAVWFDSRGLLHLRSAIRSMPEVTLVTSSGIDGHVPQSIVTGWSSDGRVFGPRFHIGPDATDSPAVPRDVLGPLLASIGD